MYTARQSVDPVVAQRINDDRREQTPTPVWHLAKAANIDEKAMMHHLGKLGIEPFRWERDLIWHVSKPDVRRLMGLSVDDDEAVSSK